MSVDPRELHALEVVLRDSRNMGVIMALSRLSLMPSSQDELHRTIRDMEIVRSFIQERVPAALQETATTVFAEHAKEVHTNFRSAQAMRSSSTKEKA